MQAEAKLQHEWVVHMHEAFFSRTGAKGPQGLRLAKSVKDTLWACALVRVMKRSMSCCADTDQACLAGCTTGEVWLTGRTNHGVACPHLSCQVRSRTFSETVGGEGITLVVPFADLANHSFNHNATFSMGSDRQRWLMLALTAWASLLLDLAVVYVNVVHLPHPVCLATLCMTLAHSFELRAVWPIAEGQEACISYGENKCNEELMRDYGALRGLTCVQYRAHV